MIIYGYREATLQSVVFEGAVCPHCGQQGHVTGTAFSRHAHVMWIPLFPIYKRMEIWCQHCGEASERFNYPNEIQVQMNDFKRSQKPRFWQFAGLFLFAAFMISMIISGRGEITDTKKFFEDPKVKDVYCIQVDDEYTLMYIDAIVSDSVVFICNSYFAYKLSEAKWLHRPNFYDDEIRWIYGRDELKEMFDSEDIKRIWRDLPYSTKQITIEEPDIKESELLDSDHSTEPVKAGDEANE